MLRRELRAGGVDATPDPVGQDLERLRRQRRAADGRAGVFAAIRVQHKGVLARARAPARVL
jgi:hypothetical protein